MQPPEQQHKYWYFAGCLILLALAFIQCYRVSHDLFWPCDGDQFRDMSFVQQMIDGRFGGDPSYKGEYMWYNPLLAWIEYGLVQLTGIPLAQLMIRAGTYLNILAPVFFFLMMIRLSDYKTALAALLSYLFLSTGDIWGAHTATYSPWLIPASFASFFFYGNILLLYQAFRTERSGWFLLLGASLGVTFLAHTAPALIITLLLCVLSLEKIRMAIPAARKKVCWKFFRFGLLTLLPFAIVSLPFTYYIVGKYHLHIRHPYLSEWREGIFIWSNWKEMIRANLSVSLVIALIGFTWFYRNFNRWLERKIILYWLLTAALMYLYTTMLPKLHEHISARLPDTVSSFHYFFSLKAIQSVFFGFGLVFIFSWCFALIRFRWPQRMPRRYFAAIFTMFIIGCTLIYYGRYCQRYDFTNGRTRSLLIQQNTGDIAMYEFLRKHIPENSVVLCADTSAIFPVMASGRKMVVTSIIFSNAYLTFDARYQDRDCMLDALKAGDSSETRRLFAKYDVQYLLLHPDSVKAYQHRLIGERVFTNKQYTCFALPDQKIK